MYRKKNEIEFEIIYNPIIFFWNIYYSFNGKLDVSA